MERGAFIRPARKSTLRVTQFGARLGSRIFFKFLLLLSDFIFDDSIAASF
jgi:hypothetical protein